MTVTPPEDVVPRVPAVRGWRWRIVKGPPLLVRDTIKIGEATREMVMEAARWSRGSNLIPFCLHGPTRKGSNAKHLPDEGSQTQDPGQTKPKHIHARYMPEDQNGDGVVEHLTVFASGGLDGVARVGLAGIGAERLLHEFDKFSFVH